MLEQTFGNNSNFQIFCPLAQQMWNDVSALLISQQQHQEGNLDYATIMPVTIIDKHLEEEIYPEDLGEIVQNEIFQIVLPVMRAYVLL